jgi:acyl dehydratase
MFESRSPLPIGGKLYLRAQLTSIETNESRALMTARLVTGTRDDAEALVADLRTFVPLGGPGKKSQGNGNGSASRAKSAGPLVPTTAREIACLTLSKTAGLDFAKLTGDFNPIHWIPAYAKAAGFRSCILHGFGTLARAVEVLTRRVFSGNAWGLRGVDVRFTRPLVLPGRAGVFVSDVGDKGGRLFVGTAAGGNAYLTGTYTKRETTHE